MGRTSLRTRPTGRSRQARPNRRKSTMLMEPTTWVMASTWTHSIHGKAYAFSRMAAAQPVA